jgi:transcriptional regulator GlxA family with amidase domain
VVLGFEGLQPLDLVGPLEVFHKANHHAPKLGAAPFRYRVIVASAAGGDLTSDSGLRVSGTMALADLPNAIDTLVVSGGSEPALRAAAAETPVLDWLRAQAGSTRRIASVCTGAFLLGGAGLLDGRRAATHWDSTRELQEMFPSVQVVADAIFVADGNVYTSAGVTAGIDLCLALVEQDLGGPVALAVARDLVLYLRRPGGQSQFSASLAAQARAGGRIGQLLAWIAERPQADLSVPALAEQAGMSERNFGRLFVAQTGLTPGHYVELVRLDRAKLYLETTDWPLGRIAERSGFGGVASLLRLFRRRLQVTPDAYRRAFRLGPG